MKTINIRREIGTYAMLRALAICVDGVTLAKVKQGDEATLEVDGDGQRIYGRMDWGKTRQVALSDVPDQSTIVFRADFCVNPLRLLGIQELPCKVWIEPPASGSAG